MLGKFAGSDELLAGTLAGWYVAVVLGVYDGHSFEVVVAVLVVDEGRQASNPSL